MLIKNGTKISRQGYIYIFGAFIFKDLFLKIFLRHFNFAVRFINDIYRHFNFAVELKKYYWKNFNFMKPREFHVAKISCLKVFIYVGNENAQYE